MKTNAQIIKEAKENGILSKLEDYNLQMAEALSKGQDTNAISPDLSQHQLRVLADLQYEITGIRVGSCNGCLQDCVKKMNAWFKSNKK